MNPNMFAQGPQSLENVPTTKTLWKNEKDQYRHWVILFGISIIAILALILVSLILTVVNKDTIRPDIFNWATGKGITFNGTTTPKQSVLDTFVYGQVPAAASGSGAADPIKYHKDLTDWVDHEYIKTLGFQSAKLALMGIGAILFFTSIFTVYKQKSFAKLSGWAISPVGFVAILGVYQLMNMFWSKNYSVFSYSEGIYNFILFLVPLFVFFLVSRPLNRIKRQFAYAERVEQIKASPQYAQMQEQMKNNPQGNPMNGTPNMGPFGPMGQPMGPMGPMGTAQHTVQPTNASSPKVAPQPKVLTPEEKKVKELSAMTIADLKQIAKKMSISGHSTMKKKELVEAIIRLSQ